MNAIIWKRIASRKRRLISRLDRFRFPDDLSRPMMRGTTPRCELAARATATVNGGIGLVHELVRKLKLAEEIDRRLVLFKVHLPYHESDHVLNLAYNTLCGGTCLEDLELRRQDEAYLNLLGADRIPDPTTAGDFCRRFEPQHLNALQDAIDAARLKVWQEQPTEFFDEAIIEADGTMVTTNAECKEGIDYSYKGVWGYHPLVVTLANTRETLRLVNRAGNRPSHEGAAKQLDECIALCRQAGFRKIVLRGDTDFSQTEHLDRWHEQGGIQFVFGYDCSHTMQMLGDGLLVTSWKKLKRPVKYEIQTKERRKPRRVKQAIVEQRQFKDIRLVDEWVAETTYRPTACRNAFRMVFVRKNLEVHEPRQGRLFPDYKFFIYITNDWTSSAEDIVYSANDRCDQENDLAQLHGSRALHAPVDNLLSNNAYMLMTSLAWNLKAWLALSIPEPARDGLARRQRLEEKHSLLRMEFRTFVNYFIRIPAQIVRSGRRIIARILGWNRWQPLWFRLASCLSSPGRY